jgi:hypothetical protein
MNLLSRLFRSEPTLLISFVRAVIVLVVAFGLELTVEQTGAILLVVEAFLALVNRSQVTPVDPPDA